MCLKKVKFHFIGTVQQNILYPTLLETFYNEHLPIQSFPFTVLKILSHFFLLGKLLGQIQPNMGLCRRLCHELWHAGLVEEIYRNRQKCKTRHKPVTVQSKNQHLPCLPLCKIRQLCLACLVLLCRSVGF